MGFKNSISLGPVISTANHLLRVCLGVISLPFEKQSQLLCHSFEGCLCLFWVSQVCGVDSGPMTGIQSVKV
jgi:hypothetical protein